MEYLIRRHASFPIPDFGLAWLFFHPLLILPLRGVQLAFPLRARLFEMLVFPNFRHDPCFLACLGKSAERLLKRLSFFYANAWHPPTPSHAETVNDRFIGSLTHWFIDSFFD